MIRWAWLNYWLWEVAWCCCQKPSVHFCKAILSMALLHDVMRLLNVTRYRLTSVSKVSQRSFWLLLCFREHLYLSIKILWKEIHFIFHTYIYCKFNITHLYSACTRVLLHHHQLCALPHVYIIINAHVQWIVRCDNLWRILHYHFPITFDLNYHSCFLIRFHSGLQAQLVVYDPGFEPSCFRHQAQWCVPVILAPGRWSEVQDSIRYIVSWGQLGIDITLSHRKQTKIETSSQSVLLPCS